MNELRKKVKLHSIKIMIVWFGLAVAVMVFMFISSINFKSLTSYCQVYNESDLNRCWKENPYVEIHTTKVYDAEYDYLHNQKKVARFVDIDINGNSMIGLMEPTHATKLFNDQSEKVVVKGKLEKFEKGAKFKGYNAIKESYVKLFKEEASREEVMNSFTLLQLNQYQGSKSSIYFFALLGIGAIILFIVIACKQMKLVIHPEKYALNKYTTLEDEAKVGKILQELELGNYDFQYKDIYLTKNYLITKGGGMKVAERNNIAWIYEKIMKQNGITTGKSWLIYSLDQKTPFQISVFGKKHNEIGEMLQKQFPRATFGYSNEYSKIWNKDPNSLIQKEDLEK